MKIIVCGAGRVGFGITESLVAEKHDVVVVDTSTQLLSLVSDRMDVQIVHGHAAHPDVLDRAGATDADMLIAVTRHDEVNIVACQVGHSLFDVPTKIARVRAQNYLTERWRNLFAREHMPIDVIMSPEIEVAQAIMHRLTFPGAFELFRFSDDQLLVLGLTCGENCPVVDESLRHLGSLFPDLPASAMGIFRDGELMLPRAEEMVRTGDLVYLAVVRDHAQRLLTIFGHEDPPARQIVLAGGGNVGSYLARRWEEEGGGVRVKIIEANRARAESIAATLDKTLVLHGDCLSRELLQEADIANSDTLVAVTNDDQVNLLVCVLARQSGCPSNLCLVNSKGVGSLVQELELNAFVDPRAVTISRVLQHIRRGRIRGVYSVLDGAGEIYEAEALETSPLVGKPLRTLHLGDGIRIGAVCRDNGIVMPTGDTVIEAGDRVVLFSLARRIRKVEQLFRVSFDFFE